MAGKAGIVLAHGLWADGSCFAKLIPALQAEGREVFASQHGLDSLAGDVDCVTRAINHVPGPVVLVGHSYGGTLITKAGVHDRVGALVYICALAPDDDETSQQHLAAFPSTPVFEHLEVADNRIYLTEAGIGDFCGDLSPEDQKVVLATASAPVADLFDQQVPGNAWRAKPSWFIVGNQDRTVNPDRERASAERMKATTVSLDSSHVPMLSQPDAVLEVIRNAAATLE